MKKYPYQPLLILILIAATISISWPGETSNAKSPAAVFHSGQIETMPSPAAIASSNSQLFRSDQVSTDINDYFSYVPISKNEISERAALIAIYEATRGESWRHKWDLNDQDHYSWYGVTCTEEKVAALELHFNNLL